MIPRTASAVAGVGIGLRSAHYEAVLSTRPNVPWFEATSENYMGIAGGSGGGRPLSMLERVRADYPIILHGVSMNIGSVDPLRDDYLKRLCLLADRIQPVHVSDHVCWTGVDGENLHDLLPLPYTEAVLNHLVPRIRQVQDVLGRRLVLENVSSYLSYAQSEMTEWEFLSELVQRADCQLLLDVNNVFVSATNHRFAATNFLEGIPVDRVAYMHLAGYQDNGHYLVDTHDHPVSQSVWDLYAKAIQRFGSVPTLIEWDEHLPTLDVLLDQARQAEEVLRCATPA